MYRSRRHIQTNLLFCLGHPSSPRVRIVLLSFDLGLLHHGDAEQPERRALERERLPARVKPAPLPDCPHHRALLALVEIVVRVLRGVGQ